jgi:uncharacterized pyridoxamine 5'-phosphate oxidase family protein
MHENAQDLEVLQQLLDDTYTRAGAHVRTIHTQERRVSAADVARILRGVRVLHLATVTAGCEPRVSPVDGLFYRGAFWFGSAHDSLRFRHVRARPAVSASHAVGETFAVIVHGRAVEVDMAASEQRGFRDYVLEVYPDWLTWYPEDPPPYARIDPERMFAYAFEPQVLARLLAEAEAGPEI